MGHKEGHIHEECIVCTAVWSGIKQKKIKPVALAIVELRLSEGVVIKPGMERNGMEPIRARATRKTCFKTIVHRLQLSIETNIVLEIVGF